MEPFHPLIVQSTDTKIHEPHIRQTGRDQQSTQARRLAELTFVDVETATFLVGEEGFDMWAFFILLHGIIQIRHRRDQIDRLLVRFLPERQDTDWAILFRRHPSRRDRHTLAARRSEISDLELDTAAAD